MTQTESYDLQTRQHQQMTSQDNQKIFGRFDPIHIGLAVCTVIFLILSIVFIILFATKHDSSTGYLVTGFSDNTTNEVSNNLKGLLNNKFTVNSFSCEVQNKEVSAVFSLRGSPSLNDVQNVMSGSKIVTQTSTTSGDKATAVCRQQQIFPSTPSPAPTTTVSTQTPTTVITSTTNPPPVSTFYCENTAITRDILVVVDLNQLSKTNNDEKVKSLQTLRDNLVSKLIFPQVQVFLKAVVGDNVQDVSTAWAQSGDQLRKDFNSLFAITNLNKTSSLNFETILQSGLKGLSTGRKYVPGAIFVITDKPSGYAVKTQARDVGVFVGVAGVNKNYANQFQPFADSVTGYDSWTDMANDDPFKSLVCTYYTLPQMPAKSFLSYPSELDDITNSTKCEVLDMIIAFDTSESLSDIIVPKYVKFAKDLVAQYRFKNNDFTRVGIITFTDHANEILSLTLGNNLDTVNAAIDTVVYTGGLTSVTSALSRAADAFNTESLGTNPSRVLIVLTDAVPTVDTYQDEIDAGKVLTKMGVATFFVGYSSYSDDVKKELGKVTKPEYVFGDMSQASFNGITQQILITYPCPLPKCVTAYFAVEISEATDDTVVKSLQDVLTISNKASTLQTGTESYQLITYNEGPINIFPKGDGTLASFQKAVQHIIDDNDFRSTIRGGKTQLDTSINAIADQLANQAKKNTRFSGNVLLFGQANNGVLDSVDVGKLDAASSNLKNQATGGLYVVDVSRDVNDFGTDLWNHVTSAENIFPNSANVEADLEKTSYFTVWSNLSCSLPALLTCFDTQVDVAVMVDLQNKDYQFMNYITALLKQFSAQDDAHFSLLAYGSNPTTVLSKLSAHTAQQIQDYSVVFEEWRNGSYFTTPAPTTTSTAAPSTSTQQSKEFWNNNLYQVNKDTITNVFVQLSTQFGCGHYGDDGDRLFAPNLYIFASDNFATYTADVWKDFRSEVHNRFGCYDCPGSPTFLFLSRVQDQGAPTDIGVTYYLSTEDLDIDESDDTSTQANINKFNQIVGSVCNIPFPQCSSYNCVPPTSP